MAVFRLWGWGLQPAFLAEPRQALKVAWTVRDRQGARCDASVQSRAQHPRGRKGSACDGASPCGVSRIATAVANWHRRFEVPAAAFPPRAPVTKF